MTTGPITVSICIDCIFYKQWKDWRDGDYHYCGHPTLADKSTVEKAVLRTKTPDWCPVFIKVTA